MLTPQELKDVQQLVSVARLSSYNHCLGTRNIAEACGAYMWSAAVSAAFSPLIQGVEIGLRNALNHTLASIYGPEWFEQWAMAEANHLRAAGHLLPTQKSEGERLIKKAKEKVKKRDEAERKRKKLPPLPASYIPNWQSVLAELPFGFWVRFLAKWYWDVNHRTKLWPCHLSQVFPGAPSTFHAVGPLHKALELVLGMRNRLHHQEPLWKNANIKSIDDAVLNLHGLLNQALQLLDFLGANKRVAMTKYGIVSAVQEVCTKDAFLRFTGQHLGTHLPLKLAKKDFRLIAKNTRDHESVWLVADGTAQLVLRNSNRRFF